MKLAVVLTSASVASGALWFGIITVSLQVWKLF